MSKQKILVAVDFSAGSDAAVELALEGADPETVDLVLLYVWKPTSGASEIFADTVVGREFASRLELAQARLGPSVGGRVEFGADPVRPILNTILSEGIDVVIVGGDRSRGSVGARVAHEALAKVITVQAQTGTRQAGEVTVSWNARDLAPPRKSRPAPKRFRCEASSDLAGSDRARAC
jgi:hypothetical protein